MLTPLLACSAAEQRPYPTTPGSPDHESPDSPDHPNRA
jgi:hypothetical protein